MPAVSFVVNGSLAGVSGRFVPLCREVAAANGWTAEFHVTEKAEAGVAAARGSALDGADLVVAVGGDGTVRGCAEGLASTGVPLGIVPHGTANLLARTLGIPGHPQAALEHRARRRPADRRSADRPRDRRLRAVHGDGGHGPRRRRRRRDQAQAPVRLARLRDVRGGPPRAARRPGSRSGWTTARRSSGRPGRSWSATPGCCPAGSACCPTPGSTTDCSTWACWRRTGRSAGRGWPPGC